MVPFCLKEHEGLAEDVGFGFKEGTKRVPPLKLSKKDQNRKPMILKIRFMHKPYSMFSRFILFVTK